MYDKLKEYIETDDGNWFWRQESGVHMNMVDSAIREIERLQAEVDRLREALGFYADEQNYHHPLNNVFCEILSDMGGLARKTLQSSDSGEGK